LKPLLRNVVVPGTAGHQNGKDARRKDGAGIKCEAGNRCGQFNEKQFARADRIMVTQELLSSGHQSILEENSFGIDLVPGSMTILSF
jgi:hypothetical protein